MALTPPPLDAHPPPVRVSPRGRPWWRHWQVAFLVVFVPLLLASTESERCSIWSWNPEPDLRPAELTVLGEGNVYDSTNDALVCESGQTCTFPNGVDLTVQGDQPVGPPPVGTFVKWEPANFTGPELIIGFNTKEVAVFCSYHNLTITMAGDKSGLIQVAPDPLTAVIYKNNVPHGVATGGATDDSCGLDGCRVQACVNSTITLTANPLTSFFTGWSGDPDCADGVVTMDDDKSCTAGFDYPDLTVEVIGNGRVYGTGSINCTSASTPCTNEFPLNMDVTLAADPNIGAEFLGWSGDCQANLPDSFSATVQLTGNRHCTAEFQGGITVGDPGVVELVSDNNGGDLFYALNYTGTTNTIGGVDISGDGRIVLFRGRLAGSAGTDPHHYYARDVVANHTDVVALDGVVNAGISQASVSADGRYVVFDSNDPTLPINNGPLGLNLSRVFVKDLVTGVIEPVTVDDPSNGIELRDQAGYQGAISGNGRYIVFSGRMVRRPSPPPAPPILEANYTVLVRDTCLGGIPTCMPSTHVVSVTSEGVRPIDPNSQSLVAINPSISADGRFVAFVSNSTLLRGVVGQTDLYRHVFLHDRDADEDGIFDETPPDHCSDTDSCPITTRLISDYFVPDGGIFLAANTEVPVISANGRYIIYKQKDTQFLTPIYGTPILLYDSCFGEPQGTCTPSIMGVPATGVSSNDEFDENPDISGDGRFISMSGNISNVFGAMVRDTCLGTAACTPETRLVSLNRFGSPAQGGTTRISVDGRAVAFASPISNLLPINTGTLPDVFLAQSGFTPTPGGTTSLSGFIHLPSGNGLPASYPPLHAGSARRLFAIKGGGFVPGALVLLDGIPRPTIYVGSAQLQFRATDDDLSEARQFQVTVLNPGGAVSDDQILFEVLP